MLKLKRQLIHGIKHTKTMFLYSVRTMTLLPTQAKEPVLALVAKDLQVNALRDLKKKFKTLLAILLLNTKEH